MATVESTLYSLENIWGPFGSEVKFRLSPEIDEADGTGYGDEANTTKLFYVPPGAKIVMAYVLVTEVAANATTADVQVTDDTTTKNIAEDVNLAALGLNWSGAADCDGIGYVVEDDDFYVSVTSSGDPGATGKYRVGVFYVLDTEDNEYNPHSGDRTP